MYNGEHTLQIFKLKIYNFIYIVYLIFRISVVWFDSANPDDMYRAIQMNSVFSYPIDLIASICRVATIIKLVYDFE